VFCRHYKGYNLLKGEREANESRAGGKKVVKKGDRRNRKNRNHFLPLENEARNGKALKRDTQRKAILNLIIQK